MGHAEPTGHVEPLAVANFRALGRIPAKSWRYFLAPLLPRIARSGTASLEVEARLARRQTDKEARYDRIFPCTAVCPPGVLTLHSHVDIALNRNLALFSSLKRLL